MTQRVITLQLRDHTNILTIARFLCEGIFSHVRKTVRILQLFESANMKYDVYIK